MSRGDMVSRESHHIEVVAERHDDGSSTGRWTVMIDQDGALDTRAWDGATPWPALRSHLLADLKEDTP